MSTSGNGWGRDALPSYQARLPQPLTVLLKDSDGSVLEVMDTAFRGYELTQEVLMAVVGKMQVHKGSYLVVEREDS